MKQIFETYAKYNARMNKQFYNLAESISSEVLKDNKGLYFSSIIGTLNHIAVGDIVWLKRFSDHPKKFQSLNFVREQPRPESLTAVLHENLADLSVLRNTLDACVINFVNELDDEVLATTVTYSNYLGVQSTNQLSLLILHFFNHQTHHRGQLSTVFSQMDIDFGVSDLLMEIPDSL